MPFVKIDLQRGKSPEYLRALSDAAHAALVTGVGMIPDDHFQIITQHEPGELVFAPTFRGGPGPRSTEWVIFTIIDGLDRGSAAKQAFYRELVHRLEADPGVRPEDVYVMIQRSGPDDFSFGSGISGSEILATEALTRLKSGSPRPGAYTIPELTGVLWDFFHNQDAEPLISTLTDDFVLKIPASLPYGGEYVGPAGWRAFQAKTSGGGEFWASLSTSIDHVIPGDGYLLAPVTTTGVARDSGVSMVVENLWLFEVRAGNFRRAQLYADTAVGHAAVH